MLDIKFIRENKDLVAMGAKKKHIDFDAEALIVADEKRRAIQTSIENKKAEQNQVSEQVVKASPEEKQALIEKMKVLKATMQAEEEELKKVMHEWQMLMVQVPNIPDMSVPDGATDAENQEIRTWGEKPKFVDANGALFTPKSHVDLMLALDMLDLERGTKVAGFRGYFLKNVQVRKERDSNPR